MTEAPEGSALICPACGGIEFTTEYVKPQARERMFLFWHSKEIAEAVEVRCSQCQWEKRFPVGTLRIKLATVKKGKKS